MAFEKRSHPLGWGDRELEYMVAQNIDHNTGKVMNITSLYRCMGGRIKRGGSAPRWFKDKVNAMADKSIGSA